jgi:hypothetical protein
MMSVWKSSITIEFILHSPFYNYPLHLYGLLKKYRHKKRSVRS